MAWLSNTYGTPGTDFGISGSGINLDRYNGFASPGTGDSVYNTSCRWRYLTGILVRVDMVVSWDNLIVGHTYLVQAWLNDGRGGQSGTSTFIGGNSNSVPVAIAMARLDNILSAPLWRTAARRVSP